MNVKKILKRIIPSKVYVKILFKKMLGYRLNLNNPKTFNEKLQYLKLYDKRNEYTKIVDKYEVKNIVENIIGKDYIIPTLGIWKCAEDIDYEQLPKSFVLKCTHDSGSVYICKNKAEVDKNEIKKFFEKRLKENFYYNFREWPYKNVEPRIIAEKYMGDNILDYKIQCFDGKPDNIMICSGRNSVEGVKYYYFDMEWNYLPYCDYEDVDPSTFTLPKPEKFEEMIELAKKLSKGYKELRVDLYNINGQIYFGELTLYTNAGFDSTITYDADLELGSKFNL